MDRQNRNHHRTRDERRARTPRKRPARDYYPWWQRMVKEEFVSVETLEAIRVLAKWEMDLIRAVETHKVCGNCHAVLVAADAFHRDNREPDGWYWKCKECRKRK